MLKYLLRFMAFLLLSGSLYGQTIVVALEPIPPLIIDARKGYMIDLLKEIERQSSFEFILRIMPYTRAKRELEKGNVQLIGLTPIGMEAPEFYEYAQDIDWGVNTSIDLFTTEPEQIHKGLDEYAVIGTPRGNEHFYSLVLGIPVESFHAGDLRSITEMLLMGRIDAVLFERYSIIDTVSQSPNRKTIYYQQLETVYAGFSLSSNTAGMKLKAQLEEILDSIDTEVFFKGFGQPVNQPEQGVIRFK